MIAKVIPSKVKGVVNIPSCKAYVHRYVLASFLSGQSIKLKGLFEGDDIDHTLNAVEKLGAKVEKNIDEKLHVYNEINISKKPQQDVNNANNDVLTLDIGESGSSLRFLLPICAALGKHVIFKGEGRIYTRPIGELVKALMTNGITFISDSMPIEIEGKLSGGLYIVNPEASSQYVTGLLFALPLLKEDSRIVLNGNLTSTPYIQMTLNVLQEFGVRVEKTKNGYYILGNQKYRINKEEINIESDWSSAGYLFALAQHFGNVYIQGLNEKSLQGDKRIVDFLKEMGASISYQSEQYSCDKSKLHSITVDATNIPDMAPLLAVLFATSLGIGSLSGVDRLKFKESDRLKAIFDMLDDIGCEYEYSYQDGGTIQIKDIVKEDNSDIHFMGCSDHRIVMCQAILAILLNRTAYIEFAESVNKSFPSFFNILKSLGINVEVYNE